MKDRERISNVEELLSDVLRRLDRMEDGQTKLIFGQQNLAGRVGSLDSRLTSVEEIMLEMVKSQNRLNDRQSGLQEAMMDLTKAVRINSTDIEQIKKTMCTKDDMAKFAAAMLARFDAIDDRFSAVDKRFDSSDKRMDTMQGDINFIKKDLTTVKFDVNHLKSQ